MREDGWWPALEVLTAVSAWVDPGQRVYLGYLLSALILAMLVLGWRFRRQPGEFKRQIRGYLSKDIWWHPSARLDYLLFVLNPLWRILPLFGGITFVPLMIRVSDSLYAGLGPVSPSWTTLEITATFTVALFVVDDFSRYLLHRMMHRVPALWSLHRLHHSAEVMTPLTVYRLHPLESLLYTLRSVLTQGLVVGVYFYAFGIGITAWELAGVNVLTFMFNLAGANLRHSHVWIGFGPWLERLFISPAQHQIHHSLDRHHHDRNFGSFLAIWDGLFGSLTLSAGERVTGFGLTSGNPHRTLLDAWREPLAGMLNSMSVRILINTTKNDLH